MDVIIIIFSIFFFIIAPYGLTKLAQRVNLDHLLSDVVACFLFGILLGNILNYCFREAPVVQLVKEVASQMVNVSVLLAIPMLLMISNLKTILKHAPRLLLSFALCVIAVMLASILVAYWYVDLPSVNHAAALLTGVYIGGTPNMVAVKYATGASESVFLLLVSTDMFCAGLYFLVITTIAKPFVRLFLPLFKSSEVVVTEEVVTEELPFPPVKWNWVHIEPLLKALVLAVLCIAIALGAALLMAVDKGTPNGIVLIICLSTSSFLLSLIPSIRHLKGVYNFAQYLLLIFAVSVGIMADFAYLANNGAIYMGFNAVVLIVLIVIHLLLSILFRVDTDAFIVGATACIFGPPFIGQVCAAINNKELIAAGIAMGVLGLVLGNYLGIVVYSMLASS